MTTSSIWTIPNILRVRARRAEPRTTRSTWNPTAGITGSRGCASTWRERAQPLGWELSIKDSKIVDELRLEPSFAGFNWGFWGYGDAGVPACFDAALTRYWDSEPFLGDGIVARPALHLMLSMFSFQVAGGISAMTSMASAVVGSIGVSALDGGQVCVQFFLHGGSSRPWWSL